MPLAVGKMVLLTVVTIFYAPPGLAAAADLRAD